MKQTINSYDFHRAFETMGRTNFSYQGLNVLFDHLESFEEDTGEEIEQDGRSILCCDFSEHDSALDAISGLGYDFAPDGDDDEEREEAALQWLRDNTIVIEFDGGVIIQGF